jgi:hypothetical protein
MLYYSILFGVQVLEYTRYHSWRPGAKCSDGQRDHKGSTCWLKNHKLQQRHRIKRSGETTASNRQQQGTNDQNSRRSHNSETATSSRSKQAPNRRIVPRLVGSSTCTVLVEVNDDRPKLKWISTLLTEQVRSSSGTASCRSTAWTVAVTATGILVSRIVVVASEGDLCRPPLPRIPNARLLLLEEDPVEDDKPVRDDNYVRSWRHGRRRSMHRRSRRRRRWGCH